MTLDARFGLSTNNEFQRYLSQCMPIAICKGSPHGLSRRSFSFTAPKVEAHACTCSFIIEDRVLLLTGMCIVVFPFSPFGSEVFKGLGNEKVNQRQEKRKKENWRKFNTFVSTET